MATIYVVMVLKYAPCIECWTAFGWCTPSPFSCLRLLSSSNQRFVLSGKFYLFEFNILYTWINIMRLHYTHFRMMSARCMIVIFVCHLDIAMLVRFLVLDPISCYIREKNPACSLYAHGIDNIYYLSIRISFFFYVKIEFNTYTTNPCM
jgi:hypothetical protein